MAYIAIKKVNGHHYAYLQESYREGGKVRTRVVDYLGAVHPGFATQIKATRRQLGQADIRALVGSVQASTKTAATVRETSPPSTSAPTSDASKPANTAAVHTQKTALPPPSKPDQALVAATPIPLFNTTKQPAKQEQPDSKPVTRFLHWPDDLSQYRVAETALHKTQARYAERLGKMCVSPASMPRVRITYGHPDRMRRERDGSYTVFVSRRTQNKKHQLNKTQLWQNTRRALSLAYLDALQAGQPEAAHRLQSELDASHRSTKRLLVQSLARASTPTERLGLTLQLAVWHSVPAQLVKKQAAQDYGVASFETLKDWRSEAAVILSEAHKLGWDGVSEKTTRSRRKLKARITRQRKAFDTMSFTERLSARLSGKRRRVLRNILADEAQLRAITELERRQQVLQAHFPL